MAILKKGMVNRLFSQGKDTKLDRPIGVVDSGVGGLTVLKEMYRQLPKEGFIYFADTGRAPYGARAKETIIDYSVQNSKFLMKYDIKFLVVACHSITALALGTLKEKIPVPMVGIVEPAIDRALKTSKNNRIGVVGTEATIQSSVYQKMLREKGGGHIQIFDLPCPLLMSLAEEGWFREEETLLIAKKYLHPLRKEKIDTLILGCSHYPLLKDAIGRVMGPEVELIDPATEMVKIIKKTLTQKRLLGSAQDPLRLFIVTDNPMRFKKVGELYLERVIPYVRLVRTEQTR